MPIYEYECTSCKNKFEELLANNKQEVVCPKCKSEKVKKLLSVFSSTGTSNVLPNPCGQPSCNSGFS